MESRADLSNMEAKASKMEARRYKCKFISTFARKLLFLKPAMVNHQVGLPTVLDIASSRPSGIGIR